jgi:hypothetical protein
VSHALRVIAVSGVMAVVLAAVAEARLPRGAVLSADEQDADPVTGVTLARGNAVISIATYAILGRADEIALRPASNEIQFRGRALITIGRQRFEGEAVTCALDFSRCVTGLQEETVPSQSTVLPDAPSTAGQAAPSPLSAGAAATNP